MESKHFKVHGNGKDIVLVGAGIRLHECLKASVRLNGCSVVDLYCVKPFNKNKFIEFAKKYGKKLLLLKIILRKAGLKRGSVES